MDYVIVLVVDLTAWKIMAVVGHSLKFSADGCFSASPLHEGTSNQESREQPFREIDDEDFVSASWNPGLSRSIVFQVSRESAAQPRVFCT